MVLNFQCSIWTALDLLTPLWLPDPRAPATHSQPSYITNNQKYLVNYLGVFPSREAFAFELETKLGEGT